MVSSRPVTPSSQQRRRHLHRSSGAYLLSQSPKIHYPIDADNLPLESTLNVEKFERLSDAIEELDVNMTNLQLIHEAVSTGFNESFASFMYGLSITMWCVDFPGCPTKRAWERLQGQKELDERIQALKNKLDKAKLENARLKELLTHKEKVPGTTPRFAQPRAPIRHIPETHIIDDDSYVTNESFVANPSERTNLRLSRIPQPVKSVGRANRKLQDPNKGPNLNQPPRYMKGLFDSSNTPRVRDNKGYRIAK